MSYSQNRPMQINNSDSGENFRLSLFALVEQVPAGKVTTYGALATQLSLQGIRVTARWVGQMMASAPSDIPWQRVVNRAGKCSNFHAAPLQRALLIAEGIVFDENDSLPLHRYQWHFSPPNQFTPEQRQLF